jgi:cobalamin biosynthesis protein CobT
MKVNIYFEIFNILNEYELLLNIYHNKKFMIDEKIKNQNDNNKKEKEININKNLNEFMDNDFLNYIFNSVKIKKNDNVNQTQNNESNNNNQKNDNNKSNNEELNNNEKYNKNDNNESNNEELNNNEKYNKNDNDELNNKNNEVNNFMKKYYRKIVILTHPDKTNDITKNNIFKKAKDNIENKFLIGIIKNCYDLKIEINDLTESLLNHIMFEIRVIQEKIIELRKVINI